MKTHIRPHMPLGYYITRSLGLYKHDKLFKGQPYSASAEFKLQLRCFFPKHNQADYSLEQCMHIYGYEKVKTHFPIPTLHICCTCFIFLMKESFLRVMHTVRNATNHKGMFLIILPHAVKTLY